jgi:phage gp36-like protein
MAYATEQDIIDIYGAPRLDMLADADADGTRDAAKVERALNTASDVIDGYISNRYALPLPRASGVLKDCCVSIAVYRMATDPSLMGEDVRQRYEDAVAFLKDIAKGVAGLGSIPTSAQSAAAAAGSAPKLASPQTVLVEAQPRVFGRERLRRL